MVERIAAGELVPGSVLTAALVNSGAIHPQPDHTRFTAADVTVVVPTLGEPAHVPDGAIVVDDGSASPVTAATVRLAFNQGPGAARNAGLELVTTELVAFVDSDVELTDGWLDPLLAQFADDRVALVAPRVRTDPGTTLLGRYEHDHSPLDLGPEPARIGVGTRVGYVPAAAIVCRTDAIRAIGGFDTALRFGEDVDLVWRLIEAGWVCRYEPAAEVHHAIRPDHIAWIRQRIGYGSSAAALARRHPGALAPIRMSGWSLGSWALAAIGRPMLGSARRGRLGGGAHQEAVRASPTRHDAAGRARQSACRRPDRCSRAAGVVATVGAGRRTVAVGSASPRGIGVGVPPPAQVGGRCGLLVGGMGRDVDRAHARPLDPRTQFVAGAFEANANRRRSLMSLQSSHSHTNR